MDALRQSRSGRKGLRRSKAPLPLPENVVLVLQGGGALGSYQAGVYQKLSELEVDVDWVSGISIGAVNAALIAGNPPEQRIAKMRAFWNKVSGGMPNFWLPENNHIREAAHLAAASAVTMFGVPGFFRPHYSFAPFLPANGPETMGLYDTTPLVETLNDLVDWDLLNNGPVRLSVGAVNIENGNFLYFDTQGPNDSRCRHTRIDARHIMASGALPPGLPPVEIDGCYYWDGGLVSNTPLAHVLDHQDNKDMLLFQVDLFPAEGPIPKEFTDIWSRQKDIQFSSRTRQVTDLYLRIRKKHNAIRAVLDKLPPEMSDDPDVMTLRDTIREGAVNIVHLIYRSREWESGARDFEFSRSTMEDHWTQGREAVQGVMHKGDLIARNIEDGATATFDLDPAQQLKEKKL